MVEVDVTNRDHLIERIVNSSCKAAGARYTGQFGIEITAYKELKTWLARYVLSVVRDSDSIEVDALRSLLSDDSPEGDTDAGTTPPDARVPDPGTVACPNCDEPVRGHVGVDYGFENLKSVAWYVCGNCGHTESRDWNE